MSLPENSNWEVEHIAMLTPNNDDTEIHRADKDNVIMVIDGKLGMEAIEDRILILVDKFKSGHECRDCEESGVFKSCECERKGTPGKHITFNSDGSERINKTCMYCNGNYEEKKGKVCTTCKGTGSTLVIPDSAKAIPTSGVIVSKGPLCKVREIGERVLFGAHTGYYLPFKGKIKIRAMRENEPLCLLHTIDNSQTALGDLVQLDEYQR
jgi:DnaJ-class molecular chaperone